MWVTRLILGLQKITPPPSSLFGHLKRVFTLWTWNAIKWILEIKVFLNGDYELIFYAQRSLCKRWELEHLKVSLKLIFKSINKNRGLYYRFKNSKVIGGNSLILNFSVSFYSGSFLREASCYVPYGFYREKRWTRVSHCLY